MYVKCALLMLLGVAIGRTYSISVEKGKFDFVKPSAVQELPDERRSSTFNDQAPENKHVESEKSERPESEKSLDSRQEKQTRTILSTPGSTDRGDKFPNFLSKYTQRTQRISCFLLMEKKISFLSPSCCGSRFDVSSQNQQDSGYDGGVGLRASSDLSRYPSRYGNRPDDRPGWQSFNPGSPGRRGSVAPSPGPGSDPYGQNGGDKYSTRPSYYGDNEFDRPGGGGNRPGGRPGYGYGGNSYSDGGPYGSNGYEVSRPGGGYGGRPPGEIHYHVNRPGLYGGGHGIYGTVGNQEDEFPPPNEPPPPGEDHPSPAVNNLQTQKAVALKALAGVALIGAAAALATNPVLLPLGVLAGRKRRSVNFPIEIEHLDIYKLSKLLEDRIPEEYKEKLKKEVLDSPSCVARLVCEIDKEYKIQRENGKHDENWTNLYERLKLYVANLIESEALDTETLYKNIKELMKSAETFEGRCDVFACDLTKD